MIWFNKKLSIEILAPLGKGTMGEYLGIEWKEVGANFLKATMPVPPGSIKNAADDAALSKKFLALSEPVLGHARAQTAIDVILSTDSLPNLGPLLAAVTPAGRKI